VNRRILLFLACAIGLIVPSMAPTLGAADANFEIVRTEKSEGVIVPRERAADFTTGLLGRDENEFWTPSRKDVLKFEEGIGAYLKKSAPRQSPNLWSKLPKYKRQYVGVVKNGRKLIYANFFCQSGNTDWKAHPVFVLDGGDCYFNVRYEVEAGAFSDLQINGEA
jgi:hypothetical protein